MRNLLLAASLLAGCVEPLGSTYRELRPGDEPDLESGTCDPPPLETRVLSAIDTGSAYHWTVAPGCLPVTVQSTVARYMPQIEGALAVWNGVECSLLRFCEPRSAT